MEFKLVDKIPYSNSQEKEIIPIANIEDGVNLTKESIIYKEEELIKIFSRKCDHSGGKLCNKNGKIICPLHGWEFDPGSSSYRNVQFIKKEQEFEVKSDYIEVKNNKRVLKLPKSKKNLRIKADLLSHATLLFSSEQFKFATDPWLQGFAFASGWWNSQLAPINWKEELNECNFIYISHNHPDHLNHFTLQEIDRDMLFIVPNFQNKSVLKMLNSFGFKNVQAFDFDSFYRFGDTDLYFSILKSGDFRDDSGFYFTYGNFDCLSSVDSNDLNFSRLPQDITLYCSSFAGGASGYPLCFETISNIDKKKIMIRNITALRASVNNQIKICNPKFFLPYAGFFKEKSLRDADIAKNNIKNSPDDFQELHNKNTSPLISNDSHVFLGDEIVKSCNLARYQNSQDNPEEFYKKVFSEAVISNDFIRQFFKNSKFEDNLKVYFELTNDDFQITNRYFHVDFKNKETFIAFESFDWLNIKTGILDENFNYMRIKVREDVFSWVLKNNLPFEDFSIGFQCRIDRVPDAYNVKFWDHFSNVYIGNI